MKKNIKFTSLAMSMVAIVVLFMFFPNTWTQVVGIVENVFSNVPGSSIPPSV